MFKANKKVSMVLFVLYVALLMILYSLYQGKVELQRKIENDLQKELRILKSKYVDISTELQYMQLEGNIEQEIKRRGLNLVKDKIPYVIYVEPQKSSKK